MAGLRREEVAMLAGASVDYYVRLERGNLAGASESVLDALARTLHLDEAEREHLYDLARASGPVRRSRRSRSKPAGSVRRNPHDPDLIRLVGELSTQSGLFRDRWASRDVVYHRSGLKRLHHPVVGDLDLNYQSMELPSEPGLVLNVYTVPEGSPTADALRLLASYAATHDDGAAHDAATARPTSSRGTQPQ